jgi:hypothetical protein
MSYSTLFANFPYDYETRRNSVQRILFLCLIIFSGCSYGVSGANNTGSNLNLTGNPSPIVPYPPVPIEPPSPEEPSLTTALDYSGFLPLAIASSTKNLFLDVTIDSIKYTGLDTLPAGWSIRKDVHLYGGSGSFFFNTTASPLKFTYLGTSTHRGYFTFELCNHDYVVYTLLIPFG